MRDEELIGELHHLGIDEDSFRVVALLPLIQVGWADGRIQTAEREIILETAHNRGMLEGDGARVLEGWLAHPPTLEYQQRGRNLLFELASRSGDLGEGITLDTVDQILDLCVNVAKAAGGLFGVIGRVEATEKEILSEIAEALDVAREFEQGRTISLEATSTWTGLTQDMI